MPISFLFFLKKKKEVGERKKKKQVRSFPENSLKIRSEFWVVKKDVTAVISTKMLVKHSHFRDVCSVFTLDLMLCVVAGAVIPCTLCKHLLVSPSNISFRHSRNFSSKSSKYSANFAEAIVPKIRAHGVCYARIFSEPSKIYHGLSFFFLERLSSFFPERKEERCGKIY